MFDILLSSEVWNIVDSAAKICLDMQTTDDHGGTILVWLAAPGLTRSHNVAGLP